MISNERLKQLAAQETMREQAEIAKELLAHRKAWSEPVCHLSEFALRKIKTSNYAVSEWIREDDGDRWLQVPLYRKPFSD
ncbi:hypothetical protein Q9R34_12790 [Enterobacter sp. BRE11]|nr:hypothetical protein [Enterobacter sp. BRE11]